MLEQLRFLGRYEEFQQLHAEGDEGLTACRLPIGDPLPDNPSYVLSVCPVCARIVRGDDEITFRSRMTFAALQP